MSVNPLGGILRCLQRGSMLVNGMINMMKIMLKGLARKFGYVIAAYDPDLDPAEVRKSFITTQNIGVIFG